MMLEILYPANPADGAKLAPYMVNQKVVLPAFTELANENGIAYAPKADDVANLQTHSYLDVPLSTDHPNYPVLVFSHGAGGEVTMYTAQLEDLASHGYIVVAINHAYGAAATVFPDGHTVQFDLSKGLDGSAPIWSQDQIFVINQLEKLNQNDPNKVFTSHLDLSNLGVFGHSLGGSAATMTCYVDNRCKAGVNEDGPVFGDVIAKGLLQPFMYMITDHRFFYDPISYKNAHGPFYEVALKGFEHFDFGDWPFWSNVSSLHDTFWLGSVDSARSETITRTYLLAFFDKYLKGSDTSLLEGSSSDYPEVTIHS
jgi:pimeloyl-ACP methyl ester carboxylesterase